MSVKIFLNFIFLAVIFWFSYKIQSFLVYENLKDLIDILKNASAMIFTIVGIWLAYIYPNAITAIVKPGSVEYIAGEQDARRIEMLVGIIVTSAVVIIGIVLFFVIKTAFSGLEFYAQNVKYIKPFGFAVIFFLSYLQITSIGKVIVSNVMFINDFHTKLNDRKIEDQM
ncbi:hypothetical protein UN63_07015 [Oceanisphaera arctica]|uniref:Uncharacterized protein n=2 Tax=Oceanisphaera arctica TaxID=641510 RepID=A0A2P5TMX4_9GAMM|nr:hypothetical protein [Oceanisphaera arctica]PPL16868.1 hypothetical protein UN63_07015 [Oceanisphaera arctica]GHA19621.1 hypothetical protein GCM10007082_20360 [Oceanisphaera arctica]